MACIQWLINPLYTEACDFIFFLNAKKPQKVHHLMLICNYKEFTSLPENRNAALEPDAAGLHQLQTSYEDSVSWKPEHPGWPLPATQGDRHPTGDYFP